MIKACGFSNCLRRKDYKCEVKNSEEVDIVRVKHIEEIDIENLKKNFFDACKSGCLKDFLKHNQLDNDIWEILLTSKEREDFGPRRLLPYGNTALMWAIANGEFPVAEELISLIIEKNMHQCFLIQSVPDQRSFKKDAFIITSEIGEEKSEEIIGEEKSEEIWQKLRKADILNNDNLLTTDLGSCSPTEYNEIYDKVSKCLGSENQQYISAVTNILGDLSVRNNPLHLIIAKGYESIFWSNSASYTNLSITILNSLNDDQAHDIARQENRCGCTPLHLALIRNNEKILKKLHRFYSPQELESAKEHIDSLTIQEKNNFLCATSRNCFKHVTHLQMLTPLKVLKSQHFLHCLSPMGQRMFNSGWQNSQSI